MHLPPYPQGFGLPSVDIFLKCHLRKSFPTTGRRRGGERLSTVASCAFSLSSGPQFSRESRHCSCMIEDEGVWSLRDMRAAMKRTLWLAGLRFVEGFLTAGWVQLVLALPAFQDQPAAAAATAAAAIHAYLLWCCFVGCLPGLNWQGGSCNPQAHAGYSQSWGEAALTLTLSGRQASGGTLCALDLAYCSPLGSV